MAEMIMSNSTIRGFCLLSFSFGGVNVRVLRLSRIMYV